MAGWRAQAFERNATIGQGRASFLNHTELGPIREVQPIAATEGIKGTSIYRAVQQLQLQQQQQQLKMAFAGAPAEEKSVPSLNSNRRQFFLRDSPNYYLFLEKPLPWGAEDDQAYPL